MTNAAVGHIASLHALRGMAALAVVVLHLSEATPGLPVREHTGLLANFFYAVDLFFILSGVVMAAVYGGMFESVVRGRDFARFMIARFARIWPMLALASSLALIAELLARFAGTAIPSTGGVPASFAAEFFGLSGWFDWAWLNPPSWSISAEFAVYLIAPFLILAYRSATTRLCLCTLLLLPLVPGLFYGLSTAVFLRQPLGLDLPMGLTLLAPEANWFWNMKGPFILMRALSMFLCGLALFRLAQTGWLTRISCPTIFVLVLALLLAGLHLGIPRLLVLHLLIALTASALGPVMQRHAMFDRPLFFELGEISLGVYLIHWPVIEICRAIHFLVSPPPLSEAGPLVSLGFILVVFVIILVSARFFYRRFEIPARQSIRSIGRNLFREPGTAVETAPTGNGRTELTAALCAVLVTLCLPAGILSQGFLIRQSDAAQAPVIAGMMPDPAGVILSFDNSAPLPVRVRDTETARAQLGPHGRNAAVVAPGAPLRVIVEPVGKAAGPARVEVVAGASRTIIEVP
ncbi:MAG: acyltransferase [Geminicoccaceae bacterium]